MANGGFFIVNTFNMLSPTGWSIQTPPELQPGGWASLDLLSAPFITSLFATLTQSQSTWRSATATAGEYVSAFNLTTPEGSMSGEKPVPGNGGLDDDTARAMCTVLLMLMFSGRAVKNFGGLPALRQLLGKLSVWTMHFGNRLISRFHSQALGNPRSRPNEETSSYFHLVTIRLS